MSWPSVELREFATLLNGRAYSKHELLEVGKYPVLRVGNFFSNRGWFHSDLELPEKNYCDKGDLLYAWSASFGPKIWDGGKVIYHYHIWKIVLNESLVDKRYLLYALAQDVESIKREQGSGSTMIHVTKTAMETRKIPLPPLEEQKRIAAILDKADAIRRKRQQAIELADQFLRSVFLDMFGDPVTNPKGWAVNQLNEIADLINGDRSSNYPSGDDLVSSGLIFLNTTNIKNNSLILDNCNFITQEKYDSLSRGKLKRQDIVITLRGSLGHSCIFDCDQDTGFINAQMMIIRLREGFSPAFVHSVLTFPTMNDYLKRAGSGSAVPQLTAKQLGELKIISPPRTLCVDYSKIAQKFELILRDLACNEVVSTNLFNALAQQAFKGELTQSKAA